MHFWAHDSFENVAQGLTAGLDAMEKTIASGTEASGHLG